MRARHVFPVGDLIEHVTDGGDCPCGPRPELVKTDAGDAWVMVHHALDGREHQEPDHDRESCPLCGREAA